MWRGHPIYWSSVFSWQLGRSSFFVFTGMRMKYDMTEMPEPRYMSFSVFCRKVSYLVGGDRFRETEFRETEYHNHKYQHFYALKHLIHLYCADFTANSFLNR
uniref:Uncharacterized protein n=1 Tax=Sphaerodactylus townsendi TaxID=933632 RepID=A0ACB8EDM1_9SAUR